ncbi:MAG: S8 family serine peptidase [Demequinaceae bacterium]|nr:S8 family serine peptidase [Demequinaceae bacterium]
MTITSTPMRTTRARRTVVAVSCASALIVACALPATATTGPNDGQWYIGPYQINEFHAQGIDGSGVTVAVVDTAINVDVPQLQGADIEVKEPSQCYGPGGVEQPSTSDDPALALHGTTVTSYIVGNGTGYDGQPGITGIAPKAKILFYSVRTQDGCESSTGETFPSIVWSQMVSEAIIDATDNGADIINFAVEASSAHITDALIYAMRNDVIVVASLKNQTSSTDLLENADGFPAQNNGVIGVGSFAPGGAVMLDGFGEPSASSVTDVVAPGVQMLIQGSESNWTDTVISQGNSFAAPIVSGNLALAIQKYPNATHDQIIQSLIHNTGSKPHELGWDNRYGYGIVDTITLLAADPTQYEDVNPLLNKREASDSDFGPSFDEVYGAGPTASPSPSASTPTDVTTEPVDPGEDTGSPAWLLLALVGGGLLLVLIVVAVIVVAVKSSNNKSTRSTT